MAELDQLEYLNLNECDQVSDLGLLQLAKLRRLKELHLLGCNRITDAGLSYLPHLTELERLNLRYCYNITEDGLPQLQKCGKLKEVDLTSTKISPDAIQRRVPHLSVHLDCYCTLRGNEALPE